MHLSLRILCLGLATTMPSSHAKLDMKNSASAEDSVDFSPSQWSRDVALLSRLPRTISGLLPEPFGPSPDHPPHGVEATSTAFGRAIPSSAASDETSSSSAASGDAASSSAASGEAAASSAASGDAASSSAASDGAASSSAASGHVSQSDVSKSLSACTNCTCVPYYLCSDPGDPDELHLRLNDTSCPNFIDILCEFPLEEPSPEIMARLSDKEYVPACGRRNPTGLGARLNGFQDGEAQFGEFPWMTIILEHETLVLDLVVQRFVCGGSLIHRQVVMTAAHCVSGKDPTKLTVRLGDWDTQNKKEIFPHEERRVAHVKRHQRFHSINLRYDVALLFLEEPVELKQHIDTLCLPEEDESFDYSSCVAAGFGKDQFHGGHFQNIMKQVDLSVVPHRACQTKLRGTRLGPWFRLHRTLTCAGGEVGVDTCRGDGGSPLACPSKEDPSKYVQAGIVAWGIGCGEDGVPGVYASVPKLVKWVNKKIGAHFGTTEPPRSTKAYGIRPPV